MTATRDLVADQREQFAFHDDIVYLAETKRGLTRQTVAAIEQGKYSPTLETAFRIADIFGVGLDEGSGYGRGPGTVTPVPDDTGAFW